MNETISGNESSIKLTQLVKKRILLFYDFYTFTLIVLRIK